MAHSFKGAIAFGLVYIPITLHSAIRENDIGFNMLEKNTMSRIKYKKTCVDCDGREVPTGDIVKGYQYEKDKYVVFTEEDFENLKTQKDKNITITQFVDLAEVDPIYFDRAYYVNPTGGEKAYALLLQALESENRAGLAKTVIGTRETLMLLRVRNGVMVANTLYFNDEVQKRPKLDLDSAVKEELALAKNLIDNMVKPFKPDDFRDEYNERLRTAIENKVAGKELEAPREPPAHNIINIMEALKKSVEMTQQNHPRTVRRSPLQGGELSG